MHDRLEKERRELPESEPVCVDAVRLQRVALALIIALFPGWALVIGSASADPGTVKERVEVPEPKSVSYEGVRYEALVWGRTRGLAQNGGYVVAIDERTGAERWVIKIYDIQIGDGKEQDKLDVFITSLKLDADKRHVQVVSERGEVFLLDLQTRAVVKQKQKSKIRKRVN